MCTKENRSKVGQTDQRNEEQDGCNGQGDTHTHCEIVHTAPAAAAALRLPMEDLLRKSKHSRMPSSPAQPNKPCTGDRPQALMPGDLAGRGDRNLQTGRHCCHG